MKLRKNPQMCISVSVFALNCWFIVTQWGHRILFMWYIFYQAMLCSFNKHFDCHYARQRSHSEKKQTQWSRGRVFRGEFTEATTACQMYSPASVFVCWTWCAACFSVCLPLSSQPTSSMRSVQALRQTTGMIRMYWATMGGSKRFVFVLSLSVLPMKTCSTETWWC